MRFGTLRASGPDGYFWRLAYHRACRVLVALDRATSFALGRPCAIQDEECVLALVARRLCGVRVACADRPALVCVCSFDIDLPTECDDEYWAHADPELAFNQPPGRPSKVAFFNCYVRLHQILAFAMRTIVRPPLLRLLFALFVCVQLGWRLTAGLI